MSAELSRRIEESVNTAGVSKATEILIGNEETRKLTAAIEIKGSEEEVAELQDVATSVRVPRVIGLAKLTQEIRSGFEKEATTNTNPELVYSLIGEKPKTLERFSEILSRIQIFKQLLSSENSNQEILSQITAWEETINEIVDQILKEDEKDKFKAEIEKKFLELSSTPSEEGKDSYQNRFKRLVQNPNALKHLQRYLKPDKGEKFGTDLIKEYFETANFINVLNLMKKLEAPIDQMSQRNERIIEPEINFLEAKKTIQEAILEVEKIKASSLDPETKKTKLAEQDQKVKDILTMCGNKIVALFPHDESIPSIETSTLKNVLKNEKAICAGKVESMGALLEFFGLKHNKILVPGHTFLDITLPSGDLLISDGNFSASTEEEKNKFYMLEAEKLDPKILEEGIDKLTPEMQIRIIRRRRTDGKIDYYLSKKKPDYRSHLYGAELSNETPIPTMVLSNAGSEFRSGELKKYANSFHAEYFTERISLDYNAEEEELKNILNLLEKGKLTTENLLPIRSENLTKILIYIKENNPQLIEKIIKENREFLEKIKKTDKAFFENSGFQYKDIIINSFAIDNFSEDLIEDFIKQENFNNYETEHLVDALLKTNFDIKQVYKIINFAKNKDEKYWDDFNSYRRFYFNLENYLNLLPDLESSIQDLNELIQNRKILEKEKLEFSDQNNLKSIILNTVKQGKLSELLNSEKIDLQTKELLLSQITSNIETYLYDFEKDKDKRNKILIDALEIIRINSKSPEQINEINSKLLQKYEDDDPKLTFLIPEIKKLNPENFYSSIREINRYLKYFPEQKDQLFEDLITNKDLLFKRLKDSKDELDQGFYLKSFNLLIKIISVNYGEEAKNRFIKETGFEPAPTN